MGPVGPAGPSNVATFTGTAVTGSIDLLLPAGVTANNLPVVSCWMGLSGVNAWILADQIFSSDPYCGVNFRADGRVQVALRNWFIGWNYFVVAVWK